MNNLEVLMNEINKQFKEDIVVKGASRLYVDKIPFSSLRANYITYGGIPLGKATEFFGGEGGGKTTSALDITKNAQIKARREYDEMMDKLQEEASELESKTSAEAKKKLVKINAQIDALTNEGVKRVVYVDLENTLDEDWARKLGVDVDSLYIIRAQDQTAEQVLQVIIQIVKTGNVILVVLDSVPMLVPQAIYEQSMEKKSYCGVAGPMSIFSSKISPLLSKTRTALVIINQMREDIENPYNLYSTPGGKALKHLYALRLMFRKGSLLDENNNEQPQRFEEPFGNLVDMTVVKTKVSKPDRRVGFYTLKYSDGIDVLSDMIDMAVKYGAIRQTGSWFQILDLETGEILMDEDDTELKFQGKAKLLTYLRENETTTQIIEEQLKPLMDLPVY